MSRMPDKNSVGEKYPAEERKLSSLVSDNVWEFFKASNAIIAGGAITSVFTNKEVNDIDVYFRSEEDLFRALAAVFDESQYTPDDLIDILGSHDLIYNGKSQRTLMLKDKETEQNIQLMTFRYFDSPEDIFESFDYTVCMGAYDCTSGEFVFHADFFKHNAQRYLKFHTGTTYPIMSLMRVDKYKKKGYDISKTELLRVLGTCMSLELSSWEDAKEHIGGMYGYDLNDVFDETKDFSVEELVEQLSNIDERKIKEFTLDYQSGFLDIVQSALDIKYTREDGYEFDDKRYLYKCVTRDWKSPLANPKLDYKEVEGQIIEATQDLHFHSNSKNPFWYSEYWVEAEIVSGGSSDGLSQKVVKKGSKVKIRKCFKHDPNLLRNFVKEYISKWKVED